MLTQERLKELLHYNPETGMFTRLVSLSNRTPVGSEAGGVSAQGYTVIRVDGGGSHMASKLAVLYMTGIYPGTVDHINRDPGDDRWCNLRQASRHQNQCNTRQAPGASGFRGVCKKKDGLFHARVQIRKVRTTLGKYTCPVVASWIRDIHARLAYGDFAVLNHPEWLDTFTDEYVDHHDDLRDLADVCIS
jgi:hypothetical protein